MVARLLVSAAALALAGAGPLGAALAHAAPAAAGIDPAANKALCDRLALALSPDDAVMLQVDNIFGSAIDALIAHDPKFATLFDTYPWLEQAMVDAMRPLLIKDIRAMLPGYRADVSALFCQSLNAVELTQAAAFWESKDGAALVRLVNSNIRYKRSSAAVMREDDPSLADVNADKREAARQSVEQLSPEQLRRIEAFIDSPAGRKFVSLAPAKARLDHKWFNQSNPESEDEMLSAMVEGMIAHIAKTDPRTAAELRKEFEQEGLLRPGAKKD